MLVDIISTLVLLAFGALATLVIVFGAVALIIKLGIEVFSAVFGR